MINKNRLTVLPESQAGTLQVLTELKSPYLMSPVRFNMLLINIEDGVRRANSWVYRSLGISAIYAGGFCDASRRCTRDV